MAEESGSGLEISGTFIVSDDLVIKQEPQEAIPEPVDEDADVVDAEVNFADLTFTEVSDVVLQRAVSPPSYLPPESSEEKEKNLTLYYKEKYNLQEAQIKLERCDKIWETLQLIKNVQNSVCSDEDSTSQFNIPNSPSRRLSSKSSDKSLMVFQPSLSGTISKAVPDFKFSVKSKKKLYYCVTCGKDFIDSQHLKQHAMDEHGILVNPKRIHTPQIDSHIEADSTEDDNEFSEGQDCKSRPESTSSFDSQHSANKQFSLQSENVDNEPNNDLKSERNTMKASNVKEKIKCILCKRICTDIVYHMKGYHKVGCISSIIAQCEKVTDGSRSGNADMQTSVVVHEDVPQADRENGRVESFTVPVRKRKRGSTCWTVKKKYKLMNKNTKLQSSGPFECNVCLGVYKNLKSFTYHRTLHRIRGETPENFDASKCRFLNSPLRHTVQTNNAFEEAVSNKASHQKDTKRIQLEVTENDVTKTQDEPVISEDSNIEQTSCECGRSFRNYHTLYLHKVKCKGINESKVNSNDTDSGIGISIKIKKNKNDSYEVVPRNIPSGGIYKDSRNSKDSDASSNDSGMVSVDYNNQRPDSSELLSKYGTSHSILRIQVADDDEEVDIEDGEDSDKGDLEETNATYNKLINCDPVIKMDCLEETNDECSFNGEIYKVPSLTNLCNQVLKNEKQSQETSACDDTSIKNVSKSVTNIKSNCPCGKKFKSFKYLNRHVRRYHPHLLKCSYCMTNFERTENYFEHQCQVTEGKLFIEPIFQTQCSECKVSVDLGEPFDKHMKTHNLDSTTFQCFKCDLKFDNQHQRKNHFNIEHGFSLCRVCNKLLHIDYILKHEAYHDGLGHPCHICKKAFDQKAFLKKHAQNAHDPAVNESLKCFVCFKTIKLKLLKKHLSFHLHTEICKKCNKCPPNNKQVKSENQKVTFNNYDDCTSTNSTTCDLSYSSTDKLNNHQNGVCEF